MKFRTCFSLALLVGLIAAGGYAFFAENIPEPRSPAAAVDSVSAGPEMPFRGAAKNLTF